MEEIKEYTLFLVKSLAKESDLVSATVLSEEEVINIEVLVKESDMGLILGHNGNTIKALRTMVQAYAYLHNQGKVKLNVEAF